MEKLHITKWAKLFLHHIVFGFYFPNTVAWKNGKSQITKWGELFFHQQVFFCGRVFFPPTVFGFSYFSVVRKMAENHGGFLPHPNKWN
jgi:hypothetical protein